MCAILVAAFVLLPPIPTEKPKVYFAAVAYSTKSGEHWFSWGLPSRAEAESAIVKRAQDRDSLIVYVARDCYLALARSKDGKAFGTGEGDTPGEAEKKALAECRRRSRSKPSILIVIHAAQGIGGKSYSCIAYSPSTHRYGIAVAKPSRSEAETEAKRQCDTEDATIVADLEGDMTAALALGKNKGEYGVGVAATEQAARDKALEACRKKTPDCSIAITISGKK